MDARVLEVLEFGKIRSLLAERASFAPGKSLAESLMPSTVHSQVERWQDETAQAVRISELAGRPPFGGLLDVRPLVRRASVGAVLRPEELLDVANTARGSERLRAYFLRHGPEAQATGLADLAESLGVFRGLEREVARCIDQEGHVVDHASPELAKVRARLRTVRRRAREYLERLVRSSRGQRFLQEQIVTLRGGRYVVPVKQEYRNEVPGIVHDQSSSGATLFVEPLPVVEANNEVRQAERVEEAEVERILTELTKRVAAEADLIVHTIEIAAALDFISAKAALATDWNAVRPRINEAGRVGIKKGRHPLLGAGVVPIDVRLGDEFTALVITGPNTGGKTVTLKTVGLFALMAQAGLHLPSEEGTEVCVFRSVFADIGDEQSIEQSLSTFSSHMSNIVSILERVHEGSLVLLDELGAGTDPTEGAALAVALLEHFTENVGCRTVATTHYSEIKHFAYSHPLCENASVEFDVETLRPTYRLAIGVAGKSNAFAISKRLGLSDAIIERAQAEVSAEERHVDDLLRNVEEERWAAMREREEAERLRRRYGELYERYHDSFEKLKVARDGILEEARREAQELLRRAQLQTEELLGALRKTGQHQRERMAADARDQLSDTLRTIKGSDESDQTPKRQDRRESDAPVQRLSTGMPVRVLSLDQPGEVVQVKGDGKVVVQVGAMRVTVGAEELKPQKQAAHHVPARSGHTKVIHSKTMDVPLEIDLRGMVSDEALESVDKYLDDATLAELKNVRIIHGKGTGALRQAVQAFLQQDPRVSGFRLGEQGEGGSGVTVAEL